MADRQISTPAPADTCQELSDSWVRGDDLAPLLADSDNGPARHRAILLRELIRLAGLVAAPTTDLPKLNDGR
jgi:hypothetical protein